MSDGLNKAGLIERRKRKEAESKLLRLHRINMNYYHRQVVGNSFLQWCCLVLMVPVGLAALPGIIAAVPFYGLIKLLWWCVMKIDDKRHEKQMRWLEEAEKAVDRE